MQMGRLDFTYPEDLIATERAPQSRVMRIAHGTYSEQAIADLLDEFQAGDVLVLNETKVMKRRVFLADGVEILFLKREENDVWQVLMPTRKLKSDCIELPGGVKAELIERGRPQKLRLSSSVSEAYFEEYGDLPLPPYIQKARGERRPKKEDEHWYQTAWAREAGSLAAPTASLHFSEGQIQDLVDRGVHVEKITLHVGLGTFLPVTSEELEDHEMHFEEIEVKARVWQRICEQKQKGARIWALGTTVTRALESCAGEKVQADEQGHFRGETNLFITPGFEFKVVDVLMTNFHQPKSTLIALVMAFAGEQNVKEAYHWAIEKKFRLFSYGDLSVWS